VGEDMSWSLESVPCIERTSFEQKVPSTIDLFWRIHGQFGWSVCLFFICTIMLAWMKQVRAIWAVSQVLGCLRFHPECCTVAVSITVFLI